MFVRRLQPPAAWVIGACLLFLGARSVSADVVTLKSGGTAQGKVVSSGSPNTVALKTSAGALIVFERQAVKNVKRTGGPPQKGPAGKTAARPQLSSKEKAWMPKVHSLVERADGPDRDQSRRARTELLNIDDENAIPAIARYLGTSPNDDYRRFYASILRNIPGTRAVYCLVSQSLFDPKQNVRDAARKAIGEKRADLARPLYIAALKAGDPNVASLAAKGIAEIGDPNGETIPYLIDAMVFQTVRVVATSPVTKVIDGDALAEIALQHQLDAEARIAANAPPISRMPASQIRVGQGPNYGSASMGGSPLGYANVTIPPLEGPMFPPMFGAHNPQIKDPAILVSGRVTLGDIANLAPRYSTGLVRETNVNPSVYDTLTKITGEQLGTNVGNWRRWWANQQKNRTLQKPKTGDRPLSKAANAPEAPASNAPEAPRSR